MEIRALIQPSSRTAGPAIMASLLVLVSLSLGCSEWFNKPAKVSELRSLDLVVGEGAEAVIGKNVVVHYVGWVFDPSKDDNKGTRFDSSRDRGMPFAFNLVKLAAIDGWIQGVPGMKVGGVRVLTIPAELAYGDQEVRGGLIPANSALVFEIELLRVRQ